MLVDLLHAIFIACELVIDLSVAIFSDDCGTVQTCNQVWLFLNHENFLVGHSAWWMLVDLLHAIFIECKLVNVLSVAIFSDASFNDLSVAYIL